MPQMPVPQTTKPMMLPAPIGGINAVGLLAAGEATDSIFQYNLIPAAYGVAVRQGYVPWATSVGTGKVGTVMPYTGSNTAANKLFCATTDGIYDITTQGISNPTVQITFGSQDANSGIGSPVAFTTTAAHYLVYADETNGYYLYTEGTGWAKIALGTGAGQVSVVDPASFAFATVYMQRLWFVVRGSSQAVYMGIGSVFGPATVFDFSNKFRKGGSLVALYTWTFDGGDGVNDYLVAISSAGDVVLYQGIDPTTAGSFNLVGNWYIGATPSGRRIAGTFGGDLYILSVYGILPLTRLISGVLVQNETNQVTAKITPLINQVMATAFALQGWEMQLISSQNLLLLATPKMTGLSYLQFVQYLPSQGWANYRDLPYFTGCDWNGQFFFGDGSVNVNLHTGNADNGVNINWSMLTHFTDAQEPGLNHRVHFIRAVFLSNIPPAYAVNAKYDYDLTENLTTPIGTGGTGSVWDVGVWDTALWAGGTIASSLVTGGAGLGRAMAIAMNGNSKTPTTLLRFDVMYDTGGML